jgi:hypothetical protein
VNLCLSATAQPLTATPSVGNTLRWYGTSATGGTATATATTPSNQASGSYYVSQADGLGCEGPRATIVVTVNLLPGGPAITSVTPLCQNVTAQPLSAVGQNVRWFDQSGNVLPGAPTPPTNSPGTLTYSASQIVNGCETPVAGRSIATIVVSPSPGLPVVVSPLAYCAGATIPPLTATPTTGNTLRWYGTSATGGTATATAPTPSNGLTATYYVAQADGSGCESGRASIAVQIKPIPGLPAVTAISVCQNAAAPVAIATADVGATLNWYGTSATGGTASGTAPAIATGAVTAYTLYVSQTLNGCEGGRAALPVSVNALPGAPTVSASFVVCQNGTPQTLSATGTGIKWYDPTGQAIAGTPVPSTTTPGSFTYTAAQVINGCETPAGQRGAVVVTVNPTPGAPTVSSPLAYCAGTVIPALTATATVGNSLRWYGTSATGGTASATAPIPSNGLTATYYVAQTDGSGCESPRAGIVVQIKPIPGAPAVIAVAVCQNAVATATATASTGATLNWYGTSATGGTASATAPLIVTTSPTAYTLYVSQTLNGCEGDRATLPVTVNALPTAPTVSAAFTICQGAVPQSLSATGTGIKWYGPTGVAVAGTPVPPTTTPGSFTYTAAQTVNSCETPVAQRAAVVVTVNPTPTVPAVVGSLSYCAGGIVAPLSATATTGNTLRWYGTSPTSGTASATAPIPSNGASATYYVAQADGSSCESDRAAITVQVKPVPGLPTGGAVEFCQGATPLPLVATATGGATLLWYGTSATGGTASTTKPTVSSATAGLFTYYFSQILDGCESAGRVATTVDVKPQPAAPGVTPVFYCQQQQDQPAQNVQPFTATGDNLQWYNLDGAKFPNAPTIGIEQPVVATVQVTQTARGCESQKATATITVRTAATPIPTPTTVVYCQGAAAVPLTATADGSLRWIDPAGNTSANAPTPATLNATNFANRPDGDPFYVFQVGTNGCYSARARILLRVNPVPTLSIVGPTAPISLGFPATLQLTFTSIPPFSYTLNDGTTGTSPDVTSTVQVLPTKTFIYQSARVTNVCGVGQPGNPATATVTVVSPIITTGAVNLSATCAGTSITVPFTTSGVFTAGNVFKVQVADTLSKNFIDAGTTTTVGPVTVTIPLTVPGGPSFVRVVGTNPNVQVNGSNSPTILNVRPRPVATLSGSQDIYEGGSAKLAIGLTGDAPWALVYTDSLRTVPLTITTNPYSLEVFPAKTSTYRLQSVSNNCGVGTVTGVATVRVLIALGLLDPLAESVKTYPMPVSALLIVDIAQPLATAGVDLTLTDLTGKPLLKQTARAVRTELNLSAQPAGMYLLRIQAGDRYTVRKVLKE